MRCCCRRRIVTVRVAGVEAQGEMVPLEPVSSPRKPAQTAPSGSSGEPFLLPTNHRYSGYHKGWAGERLPHRSKTTSHMFLTAPVACSDGNLPIMLPILQTLPQHIPKPEARDLFSGQRGPIFTARCPSTSPPQIVEELRGRVPTRHQQIIPRTGTGDVEQMAFGVVDLGQI